MGNQGVYRSDGYIAGVMPYSATGHKSAMSLKGLVQPKRKLTRWMLNLDSADL